MGEDKVGMVHNLEASGLMNSSTCLFQKDEKIT